MRNRSWILISACLLLATGACLLWLHENHQSGNTRTKLSALPKIATTAAQARPLTILSTNNVQAARAAAAKAQQFHFRLSNTTRSIGELTHDPHAILLANALIDTDAKLDLSIPKNLQAPGEPGAYIVQANGPIDNAFRAMLAQSGAQIVSYIPNNAYLVMVSQAGADELGGNPMTQAVIPYEPYYKLTPSLLAAVANNQPVNELKVAAFPGTDDATKTALAKMGITVGPEEASPFGPIFVLKDVSDVAAVAQIPTLHIVEPIYKRAPANDLSRATVGVAADTQTTTNYLGLTGKNVLVEVNDTGIDGKPGTGHPDLRGRVFGDSALSLVDTNGHGTHVAGTIAGDGTESTTVVTNAQGSIMPGAKGQFRGMAPAATLYSVAAIDNAFTSLNFSDQYLQEAPALTNALISNNSWNYSGDNAYDIAAASYDAAVRDALPKVTGSQPVLFVFSSADDGGGNDNGNGGNANSILSPATAKNVITVGALEQLRNITNQVQKISNGSTNVSTPWQPMTDTSYEVAGYSGRGNVGVGTEGTFGRFKPDVVMPGTFVISTRSQQWDTNAYYNPTNVTYTSYEQQLVVTNTVNYYSVFVPDNAVSVKITVLTNGNSPVPFPQMPVYVSLSGHPDPANPATYDFVRTGGLVSIPPDSGGAITGIQDVQGLGFNFAVGDGTNNPVNYDMLVEIATTNNVGNYYQVLQGLNDSLGGFYRYETGTSMSAADASGVLALMQDYFINTLHTTPSPALLKAMLINGARPVGFYDVQVQNSINYQGWGLATLTNALPPSITNLVTSGNPSIFFQDQNPTNALATGDSQVFLLTITNASAQAQPLRLTLTWTDPPGDPSAAVKLVNNLGIMVSNVDSPTGPAVFYGNDIGVNSIYNTPESTNSAAILDGINNVENVFISPPLGSNYTITIFGSSVNVNAVTAQTNTATGAYAPNVVQDYALVISSGDSQGSGAFTVTPQPIVSNPTTGQQITGVTGTNAALLNQFVGASSPLLGTNTVPMGTNFGFATNAIITLGQTNQWHFYIVTNNGSASDFTNAAFITFLPETLSIPRMGVFADSTANATTPDSDIDLYVATDSTLTNLNPAVIFNCVHGTQVGLSAGGVFNGASLSRGGTEFVVDMNSIPGQVYYVGVKSERQTASEYAFLSEFSNIPFSQQQTNGNVLVNFPLISGIPDGTPTLPGFTNSVGLAIYPIQIRNVIVTNILIQQNVGDLVTSLSFNNTSTILMNHDSPNAPGIYSFTYDDSGQGDIPGSQPSDGPGSLSSYVASQGLGVWTLHIANSAPGFVGSMEGGLLIEPHKDLTKGITVVVQPGSWFYEFIDVPVGSYNLTVSATNLSPTVTPPLELFVKLGSTPTAADTNVEVLLNNPGPLGPGNSISTGPPLTPGRYWVGIFNPSLTAANVYIIATLGFSQSAISTVDFRSGGPVPILDDAVTTNSIFVTNTDIIQDFNVGLRVDHPRISDLVFHLISPDGTRYLLMENRGGTTTNGCGATITTTNIFPASSSGGPAASTNVIDTGRTFGALTINYNFYTVPDQMTVYYSGNVLTNFFTSGSSQFTVNFGPGASTFVTIVMNATNNPPGTLWDYTAGGMQTNYLYLAFTDDTNLTTTPIKFAPPPFVPTFSSFSTNFGGWESATPGNYAAPTNVAGWGVAATNPVSVVNDPPNAHAGNQFLALALGTITNTMATVPGNTYTLTYDYRGPGIAGWWRGEGNAKDSLGLNNGTLMGGASYVAGEVGQGFQFVNHGDYVNIPASPSLNIGAGGEVTLEAWIEPASISTAQPIFDWLKDSVEHGIHLYISQQPIGSGDIFANLVDTANVSHRCISAGGIVQAGVFQHVAVTYNQSSGICKLYYNGTPVFTANLGSFTPKTTTGLTLGERFDNSEHFVGVIDEPSIYNRVLSDSEIKAIYNRGITGKFDNRTEIPAPQNLAEATVTIPGIPTPTSVIYGGNTNWQTGGATFTATGSQTPIIITGLQPGILLDNVTLFGTSGGHNLYYQGEEPMDGSNGKEGLNGLSAFGTWTLEVQDDRAGAANGVLQSWQLEFEFANTNFIPIIFGQPGTNVIPPGGVVYIAVDVPVNADMATNVLVFSTGPKNIWYDTNNPPTTNVFLFGGLSGSYTLTTTGSAPTNLVPGSTYYIIEQNTNSFTITNDFVVNFHFVAGLLGPFAFTQPANAVTGTGAQLNGMATPNGLPATAWFQWGTSTAYGNQTPPVSVGTGTNVVYVANTISGLLPNVPYHFRLVVTNALGVTTGFDQILDEANVVAWGANYLGQTTVPAGLSNVVAVAGAYDHSLALKPNETAVAWGDNTFGQGTVPAALSNFLAVAGGAYYSMALENNETVASWGANILSQTNVPAGLNSVVEIAGGTYSSLALQSNGVVVAWGAGFFNLTNVPAGLSNVVAIAGGSYHNLAIRNDGTVTAWGDDSANQTNVPAGLTNAVAISAGSYHSLALKYDGTVVAWGDNSAGQTNVPAGLTNVVAIAAGGFHSLALKNDGTIVAWGDNSAGQKNVPAGVTNFVAIAAGYFQSLALTPQSLANLTIVLNITNGVPLTNNIVPGGIVYYQVNVPMNADFATNTLLFASAPLNVWFSTNNPPTTNVFLFSGTNGAYTLSTTGAPPLVPGSTYYLGVQNTNNATVDYGVEVDFHLLNAGNPISGLSVTYTNIAGTNGFLLTWFAPTNDVFQVQRTDALFPQNWQFFTNFISYTGPLTATNGLFSFFDDGSQTPPGLPPVRFYRILLAASGSSTHTNLVFISSVTSTNIGSVNGYLVAWHAPTNYLFEVQWTTNLLPVIWQSFPNIIAYSTLVSPTNSLFDFFDDGSFGGLGPVKFYRLLILP